ncbi:MAG TPA: CRISPR-associated endonuclease Cas1 [Anaerolineae bacterium]|nr:CRISPR-associated endonuclease Cas1 [Anaerolineae bacterium]HPL29235.1 CRISPR-associated endonuclease Cas1 [Anaerolineae bacterium]
MHLIVDGFGSFLGAKSERLQVRREGKVVEEIALCTLEGVLISGRGVSLSCEAVQRCVEAGIPISFLSWNGAPYARLEAPGLAATVQTRRAQLLAYEDGRGVALALGFAGGKLANQANLLKYMAKYRHQVDPDAYRRARDAAIEIEGLQRELSRLKAGHVDELRPALLNREGRAAAIYWETVAGLLNLAEPWVGREHRGAADPLNSALNYGYGILYSQVEHAAVVAGLDPYGGFVHVDRPGKPSLVLDLIEEFRQPAVDRTIFGLVNKRVALVVNEDGLLDERTRKTLAEKVLARLDSPERHEGHQRPLRHIIQAQARHVAAYLRGERAGYEPFTSRW